MKTVLWAALFVCWTCVGSVSGQQGTSFEASETSRLLGVRLREFSPPQGVSGFDDLPESAIEFNFLAKSRPLTGPTPLPGYEPRKFVTAQAPDGSIYEAYSGRFSDGVVLPGPGSSSSNQNPRQRYATHHGYGYNPSDVFIGRRERGKIRTSLFFRDVGSHDTAPYYFTIDANGQAHLIVADVNISDDNELNVYSIIGDPGTGKWIDAVILDRRGFTSRSHPWAGVSSGTVHLLWDWGDATYDKANPNMGLFYVDWTPKGYGRKTRVIKGLIESYDAVVDLKTGQLVIVASVGKRIYLACRTREGAWRKPAQIRTELPSDYIYDVSVQASPRGVFSVRTSGKDGIEWAVRPR